MENKATNLNRATGIKAKVVNAIKKIAKIDTKIDEVSNMKSNIEQNSEENNKDVQQEQQNPYTRSTCVVKQNRAEILARHNEAIHLTNKEMLKQERLGNSYNIKATGASTEGNLRSGGRKFFADCPTLGSNVIGDKFFMITKSAGEDYKLSYSELVSSMKKDLLRPALKEQIGHMHFNTSNHLNLRDNPSYKTEYFEYLMLDGRELKTKDYPELAEYLYAGDKESFNLPNMQDGTIRNIKRGSGRANGSFQDDAMQSHNHSNTHNHGADPHAHWMQHQHNYTRGETGHEGGSGWAAWSGGHGESTWGGRDWTDNSNINIHNTTITTDSGNGRTDNETRMKNMGVQAYICAKVLI